MTAPRFVRLVLIVTGIHGRGESIVLPLVLQSQMVCHQIRTETCEG